MSSVKSKINFLELADGDYSYEIEGLAKLNQDNSIVFINKTINACSVEYIKDMQYFSISGVKTIYLKGVSGAISTD